MPKKNRQIIAVPNNSCNGCSDCVEACKQTFQTEPTGNAISRIKILKTESSFSPVMCRNCQDAPCVTTCMTGCITLHENGPIITDYNRCVGCWMCIMSCPFGAIERDVERHIAVKCNSCPDKEIAPCVAACERGVLFQMEMDDFTSQLRKESAARFIKGYTKEIKV